MRNLSISFAVAGILASAAASAATHDVFIGGASAQSAFFKADFGTSVCGGAANVKTYTISNTNTTPLGTATNPANEAWRCNASATVTIAGVAAGEQVTVHYNSELGSISGVAPLFHNGAIAKRLFVNPDSTDCPAVAAGASGACTVAGYDNKTETFAPTTAGQNTLAPVSSAVFTAVNPNRAAPAFTQFDLGVTDVEVKHWAAPYTTNWTDATFNTAMGTQPTSASALTTAAGTALTMNGQVFSVIVNNGSPLVALGINNLSKASLEAIFSGKYDVWGDVPEVGGNVAATPAQKAVALKYCRREYGSGTQVSASIFFTGNECSYTGTTLATVVSPVSLTKISEEASTGGVRQCVQGGTFGAVTYPVEAGAIGVASLSRNAAAYTTIAIDGAEANAHNAATQAYMFWMESQVYNKSTTSGATAAEQAILTSMITNARRSDRLTTQVEPATNTANGQWTSTAPKANMALPIGGLGNTPASVAKATATATNAVVSLTTRGGDNCKIMVQNANTL